MNILFISAYYPPYTYGGAEISTSLLVKQLSAKHNCKVLTSLLTTNSWLKDGVEVIPLFKIIDLGNRSLIDLITYSLKIIVYPWINAFYLFKYLRNNSVDVIHIVPNTYLQVGLIFLIHLLKIPCVIDIRDATWICMTDFSYVDTQRKNDNPHSCFSHMNKSYKSSNFIIKRLVLLIALYETTIFMLSTKVIKACIHFSKKMEISCLSNYLKDLLSNSGFNQNKIHVIANLLTDEKKSNYPRKNEFVYAGRLEKAKGIWQIIKSFEIANIKNFSLHIYGVGTEFSPIQKYIDSKNIKNIFLHGKKKMSEIIEVYKKSFAIVSPSVRPEPLGRYVLDSFATLTPLITSNEGGPPEFIKDRHNGMLVSPTNIEELSEAMKLLVRDKKLYTKITNELNELPIKLKTSHILEQRLSLYHSIIERT